MLLPSIEFCVISVLYRRTPGLRCIVPPQLVAL